MSAFLFTLRTDAIKKMTDEELEACIQRNEARIKDVKWESLKQCTFDFDQAYGSKANLEMAKREQQLRKDGKGDQPLERTLVPGFNPPENGEKPVIVVKR